jgi:ABC-type transport system involved in cytochrome bd biosynthesis fused ATPase/permease subunit
LKTPLISGGRNLSRGQLQRLLIARAIVTRPHLLILDEAFTGIDERDKLTILGRLYAEDKKWTIIDISHDPEVVTRSDTIYVLEDGKLVETHTGIQSNSNFPGSKSRFAALFPSLRSPNVPPSYVKNHASSSASIQTNAAQVSTNSTNASAS